MIPSKTAIFYYFSLLLKLVPFVSSWSASIPPTSSGLLYDPVTGLHASRAEIAGTVLNMSSKEDDGKHKTNNLPFDEEDEIPASVALNGIRLCRKEKQKRRKMRSRRPSAFWADINNIEFELRKFWSSVNVNIDADIPPPIPNEALLNHFERHDIRYGIANSGGRNFVAERLGGAKLIPGKWFDACSTSKEVQCLILPDNPAGVGLSRNHPPIAPHVKKGLVEVAQRKRKSMSLNNGADRKKQTASEKRNIENMAFDNEDVEIQSLRYQSGERWAHSSNRNPRGYWDEDKIVKELYLYLSQVEEEEGRPSVWMARPSELQKRGRDDLKQAINRFGGANYICQRARVVPYKDWRYFESTFELFMELQLYLVMHEEEREEFFPKLSDINDNGHERLYNLIMEYGGRKMIATKLDMDFQTQTKVQMLKGMSFGKFSLDFAIKLMHFIRKEMLNQTPPMSCPKIKMPTVQELIERGETKLAKDVMKYGGHECIARRLNLTYDRDEARRDALSRARKEREIAEIETRTYGMKSRVRGDTSSHM